MVEYFENGDLAIFKGMKYRRDKRTGYYLNSATSTRLHRAVWMHHNGIIPHGYHIHHADEDKGNNEIENLELICSSAHLSLHGNKRATIHYAEMVDNLMKNAVPKAKAWHGGVVGRDWHKQHYEATKHKLHANRDFTCAQCRKQFTSPQVTSRFCSNKCKSAYRRASGVDNITKICKHCGGRYIGSKYNKTKYCSATCSRAERKAYNALRNRECIQHGS